MRIAIAFPRRAVLLATLLLTIACGPAATPPQPEPDQSYRVRGEIVRLPESGASTPEIWIRHQAIPEFAGEDGRKVGMDAMTMPFAVAPGLALDGFAPGDKIAFTLEVRWADRAAPARVAKLERLPVETELVFGPPGK